MSDWQDIADARNRVMTREDIVWRVNLDRSGIYLTDCPAYANRHRQWMAQKAERERQDWIRNHCERGEVPERYLG
jgi:hypothetical protein